MEEEEEEEEEEKEEEIFGVLPLTIGKLLVAVVWFWFCTGTACQTLLQKLF